MSSPEKQDIGRFYRTHGANGARYAVEKNQRPFTPGEETQQNTHVLPPMKDVMDFLDEEIPEPIQLIHGLLDKGSKMIVSSHAKARKTWNQLHLAMCVAAGVPWWGFATTKGKVLYANFEIAPKHFQKRIKAMKEKMVLCGNEIKDNLTVWNLRGHATDIKNIADEIIARAKGKYDLIIIDPIYKVLGDRDENSNGDVADMMNYLDRITVEAGAAVVFAHHFSKGNQSRKDAMDRMSGAGAFGRDADTMIMLTKHELPETLSVEIEVRNYKRVEPFCVTLDHPIMERNDVLSPSKLKSSPGTGKQYFLADLLKTLGVQQLIRAELERQFLAATGASEGTFDKLFKEAQEKPDIERCEDGKKWKAVHPIFPPGYNACSDKKGGNSATVQE